MSKIGSRAMGVLTAGAVLMTLLLAACGGTSAISTSVAVAVGTVAGAATPGVPGGTPRPSGGGGILPPFGSPGGIIPGFGSGTPVVPPGVLATTAAGLPTLGPLPSNLPTFGLRSGTFEKKAKDGSGRVDVVPGPLGTVVNLGLDFSVTNGPQLRVYLTKVASPNNQADIDRGFVDLGALQNTQGLSIYTVPNGTVLNDYLGVAIYSTQEKAVYSAAKLSAP